MRSVLLPLVLALLLSYLLRPIVRGLARLKVPLPVSAAVLLIGFFGLLGYGISTLATPTAGWLAKAPAGFTELQQKLLPVRKSVAQVTQATEKIEKLASANTETRVVEVKRHPQNKETLDKYRVRFADGHTVEVWSIQLEPATKP